LQQRLAAERVAAGIGERQRDHADRQAALGGHALELTAGRIGLAARGRRGEHHQRERPLPVPDAAPGDLDRRGDRGAIEQHLWLAAGTGGVALHVAGGIGDKCGERRVVERLAAPRGAHQRLAHGVLHRERRLFLEVDLVNPHRTCAPGGVRQRRAERDQGGENRTRAPPGGCCSWIRLRHCPDRTRGRWTECRISYAPLTRRRRGRVPESYD
jgi:hypothetical protein